MVIVGAWVKRYFIIVPTLRSPYLPSGQRLPWSWTHYHPSWVEWSITAAAVAGFMLIYTLMAKLFPIVSIWETREQQEEEAAARASATSDVLPSRWWKAGAAASTSILAAVVLWSTPAHAAPARPKQPKPATISAEWKLIPAEQISHESASDDGTPPVPGGRVYLYSGRPFFSQWLFGSHVEVMKPLAAVAVIATLRDPSGAPISFKPVEFSAKTEFGTLAFGSRPTLADGKVQLILKDHRYGSYPVQVVFPGDEEYAPATFNLSVDFGERPAAMLPQTGVLITPYATSPIAVPFLLFYGTMWVAFVYTFGYLILWKMRTTSPASSVAPAAQASAGPPAGVVPEAAQPNLKST
jgi:hypothetical protein